MSTSMTFIYEAFDNINPDLIKEKIVRAVNKKPIGMSIGIDTITLIWGYDLSIEEQVIVKDMMEIYEFREI